LGALNLTILREQLFQTRTIYLETQVSTVQFPSHYELQTIREELGLRLLLSKPNRKGLTWQSTRRQRRARNQTTSPLGSPSKPTSPSVLFARRTPESRPVKSKPNLTNHQFSRSILLQSSNQPVEVYRLDATKARDFSQILQDLFLGPDSGCNDRPCRQFRALGQRRLLPRDSACLEPAQDRQEKSPPASGLLGAVNPQ
jgi:hypothetical protein